MAHGQKIPRERLRVHLALMCTLMTIITNRPLICLQGELRFFSFAISGMMVAPNTIYVSLILSRRS